MDLELGHIRSLIIDLKIKIETKGYMRNAMIRDSKMPTNHLDFHIRYIYVPSDGHAGGGQGKNLHKRVVNRD